MCGRFTIQIPSELLLELFGIAEHPTIVSRYNVAPTQIIPVVRQHADGRNRLDLLRWGLVPAWAKDLSIGSKMINARSETISEKPSFRQAVRCRRCLVLASGFYEWKQEGKVKLPRYIRLKDASPMIFAALWDCWKSPEGEAIETCSILTTVANPLVAHLHERMPVILSPEQCHGWLDREVTDPADLEQLFRPYPADLMEMWPVSPLVNSVKNQSPDLINPFQDQPLLDLGGSPT